VIAIENVRLFNETKEALQQQTATAEVLKVISGSVADAAPVFDKILESCDRLFASNEQGILLIGDDGRVDLAAHHGHVRDRLKGMFPSAHTDDLPTLLLERGALHIATSSPTRRSSGHPRHRRAARHRQLFAGVRADALEGRAIGTLYVTRQPPTGFSDKEVELLRTFADQAVIAIQNARLFNETKEALQQQTATGEVLQVISSSVADAQPVFEKILDSCQRLFASSEQACCSQGEDGLLHLGAHTAGARAAEKRVPARAESPAARWRRERRIVTSRTSGRRRRAAGCARSPSAASAATRR
jgi:GAF domain-containing protein